MKRTFLFAALLVTSANGTTITITPASTIANAGAARDAWIVSNFGAAASIQNLENFEGFGYGPFTQLATGPGTFSVMDGSLPSFSNGTRNNEFTILTNSNTPFIGRYDTTSGGNTS